METIADAVNAAPIGVNAFADRIGNAGGFLIRLLRDSVERLTRQAAVWLA
jgi:hypothetical protein